MKALIFGAGGQDGFYLDQLLKKRRIKVIGVDKSSKKWLKGDVGSFAFVESLIRKNRPDYVYHLAAISSTSHDVILDNHETINTGTLNILESVRLHCPKCKVFLSGSALQFKNIGKPINEKTPFEAKSAYAVERIQSVYMGRYYRETFGMGVYIGYFFNHDSPIRPKQHVSQYIVESIKRISKGGGKMEIGDINVKKEFGYAGDVVEAIWILINQNKIYEAIIGTGKAHSLKEWVNYCFKKVGMDWKKHVVAKENYKAEYKILVSDPGLIRSLGWKPKVGFLELADIMMN